MFDEYEDLKRIESDIDDCMLRKHLQIEEEHNTRLFCIKKLRFFLTVNVTNESLLLRLDGQVINDYKNTTKTYTSELIKRLCIVFENETEENKKIDIENDMTDKDNKEMQENYHNCSNIENHTNKDKIESKLQTKTSCNTSQNAEIFEWEQESEKIDSFELMRTKIPKKIKIIIEFDNSKDLVKLSEPLQKLLNLHTTTKTNAIIEMWKYLRINKLIDNSGNIICADMLKDIFDSDLFHIDNLTSKIYQHFLPLDLLSFNIPIKCYERVFDIVMERDDLSDVPIIYKDKNIAHIDRKIQNIIDCIENIKEKKNVLEKYIKNPIKFIDDFLVIDKRNVDFLMGGDNDGVFYDPTVVKELYNILKKQMV